MVIINNTYLLILAGGKGTRLWPLSRAAKPKQVLNLHGQSTMIQQTCERFDGLIKPENIFVMTNDEIKNDIIEQLPNIKKENIICEPVARGTASCIAVASHCVYQKDRNSILIVVASDHIIEPQDEYRKAVEVAAEQCGNGNLVLFGIPMTEPNINYGYVYSIERKEEINGINIRKVERFVEKPDYDTAVKFFEDKNYYINSGMFVFRADAILESFKKHLPDTYLNLEQSYKYDNKNNVKIIKGVFEKFENISIDCAIMEKEKKVVMIEANFKWKDIGLLDVLCEVCKKDTELLEIDSGNCYAYSDKLSVFVGAQDLILIETPDVILVCNKRNASSMSKVVGILKNSGKGEYL